MRNFVLFLFPMLSILFAQNLPDVWSQSYCTYDIAEAHVLGEYSLGFSLNNYCIYTHDADTVSYDERRFDIFASVGLGKNTELEIKYSYPTCGVIGGKYQFLQKNIDGAFKFGFGYMKGTRTGLITDYVFDFYPTFILSMQIYKNIKLYLSPKIIYSIHIRDRQEHSEREPRYIFQYGSGFGLSVGNKFSIIPESNWLFGDNMDVKYTVNQFGIGVKLKIDS